MRYFTLGVEVMAMKMLKDLKKIDYANLYRCSSLSETMIGFIERNTYYIDSDSCRDRFYSKNKTLIAEIGKSENALIDKIERNGNGWKLKFYNEEVSQDISTYMEINGHVTRIGVENSIGLDFVYVYLNRFNLKQTVIDYINSDILVVEKYEDYTKKIYSCWSKSCGGLYCLRMSKNYDDIYDYKNMMLFQGEDNQFGKQYWSLSLDMTAQKQFAKVFFGTDYMLAGSSRLVELCKTLYK